MTSRLLGLGSVKIVLEDSLHGKPIPHPTDLSGNSFPQSFHIHLFKRPQKMQLKQQLEV